MGVKMYKIRDIVRLLLKNDTDEYCGFCKSENGNLVIILKDHAPGWRDSEGYGEAVEELELLEDEGEY